MRLVFILIFTLFILSLNAQTAWIYGTITNEKGKAFDPAANVSIQGYSGGTYTNEKGEYRLKVVANKSLKIQFSHVSYQPVYRTVQLSDNESYELNVVLNQAVAIDTFSVTSKRKEEEGLVHIDPKKIEAIPAPSGDALSTFIKSIPGVYSNNELSAQYSVRGGNFDENLVYVNGIEIQRPMLIKSGQQEGLNFVNSDLVDNIKFSAGGFSAFYGDKMSSVLDVSYKKPTQFAASADLSLLGAAMHLEGVGAKSRLRYLGGVRYKSNQYVLRSLDTDGEYKPKFLDVQAFIAYDLADNLEISFLGNLATNQYNIVPQTRETNFGTFQESLRFTVYFDGHEVDEFQNSLSALNLKFHQNQTQLDFNISYYRSSENETYDIMGQYWLSVLQNDMSKDDFGEVLYNKGVGTFLDHARNYLFSELLDVQHRGQYELWSWGADVRFDFIEDQLSEWSMIDSNGYSLPHPPDNIGNLNPNYIRPNKLEMDYLVKSENQISSRRYSAYLMRQGKWQAHDQSGILKWEAGLRTNYWDYNGEWLISPRASLVLNPYKHKHLTYRLTTGLYSQPAFYREMRDISGAVNPDIKAQKSAQLVVGTDVIFEIWNRPFKFTSEAYYKYLWDLIPYEVEDVHIRYFATNNAVGYATGIDLKLHGELVKDAESWVGLSLMKTAEDLNDDFFYEYYNAAGEKIVAGVTYDNVPVDSQRFEPGYIPRPTDQRFSFNLFFQDYIPGYPSFKVHLNLVYASGLPFGPPTHKRYQQTQRYPAYRRIDVGFSKQLVNADTKFKAKNPFRFIKSAWISLEVFNLFQINNTLSYTWISDISGQYYAIPSYLTGRQINLHLSVKF